MKDDQEQAAAAAREVGLEEEFLAGDYSAEEVTKWANEQRAAWQEAAKESIDEARDASLVRVRMRNPGKKE